MPFSHNHKAPVSRRLIFALLFSLVLHTLLLFFIRFTPTQWESYSGRAAFPLNVFLVAIPAEIIAPAAIKEANQDNQGTAKAGVQNNNDFSESPLTAANADLVEQPKTDIPKDFIRNEILTVKKSPLTSMLESEADLLSTKISDPNYADDSEQSYAPAPSVAKPATEDAPSFEKLVSSEPVIGDQQPKITFAGSAQEEQPAKKPESIPAESNLVEAEKTQQVNEVPKPIKIEEPKPEVAPTKPVEIETPKPVTIDVPKPVKIEEPTPVKVDESKLAKTGEPKPVIAEVEAKTRMLPDEAIKPDIFIAGAPTHEISSLADLSIASIRKVVNEDGKKIKFGERRKTVGVKEKDFQYAMYVEGVVLKLQRIGMFNYPAAAARGNISGTLGVLITIHADGSLEEFRVTRPSVYEDLNKGAENIIRMSAPFSPLPENIRQGTDMLSININWSFSNSSQSFD